MSQASHHARQFTANRSALLDLYDMLPEDQGKFAAWDGGMSFIGLADHLSGSLTRFMGLIAGEGMGTPAPASTSLDEARQRLRDTHQTAVSAIEGMNDADLDRRVPAFGGREMPVRALLDMVTTHEVHHKGQVWMMARMVGVQPPMFVKMG